VEGVVVDAKGDPVPGARVAKDRVLVYLAVGAAPAGLALTDAHGHFKLGELPEGSSTLEAYAPDVGRARFEVHNVREGRTVDAGRITLEKGSEERAKEPSASGGVAVTLGETGDDPHDVVIVAVADGSEAERAGLRPGDIVVEVDGVAVHTLSEARSRLSGPVTDDVIVKVRRGARVEELGVAREQVRR
jgi:S1-C subfamily serine protease